MKSDPLAPAARRVPGHNGVAINVWDYGGDRPPLILCHCTGTLARVWDPLVPALATRFRVIAPDTRGHGDSDKPADPDAYRWANSGHDLLAVIDAFGLGPRIAAMGHSAGAAHIAYAQMLRPGAFGRAVLMDPIIGPKQAFRADNPLAIRTRRRVNDFPSREAARERYASKPPMGSWHPDCLNAYVAHAFADKPDGTVTLKMPGTLEAEVYARSGSTDVFEVLDTLDFDAVLLVTSDGSDVRQLAELQRERFRNATFRVIEGASHFIPQEKPAEIARMAREFLADGKA